MSKKTIDEKAIAQAREAILRRMPREGKIEVNTIAEISNVLEAIIADCGSTMDDKLRHRADMLIIALDDKLRKMIRRCCYGYATQCMRGQRAHTLITDILQADNLTDVLDVLDDVAIAALCNDD